MKAIQAIITEEIQKLRETGYYDDQGVIRLYHRVGVKNYNSYPELIKSIKDKGLVTNDNREIGDAIWFSNDFSDYGDQGMFVVALDFDTATNGVANNKYGIVYDGHNAYGYNNVGFEDLVVIKIPVGQLNDNHVITNVDAIKYINDEGFLNPSAINAGQIDITLYKQVFNTYVQPHIDIKDFIAALVSPKLIDV